MLKNASATDGGAKLRKDTRTQYRRATTVLTGRAFRKASADYEYNNDIFQPPEEKNYPEALCAF